MHGGYLVCFAPRLLELLEDARYTSLVTLLYKKLTPASEGARLRLFELVLNEDVAALRALAVAFALSGYVSTIGVTIGWDIARFLLVAIAPVAAIIEPCRPRAVCP